MKGIHDKLEHFNQIILKEAASIRDGILKQMKEEKDTIISKKTAILEEQADEMLKTELQKIDKERNDIISKAFIESRQLLRKTREKISEAVLADLHIRIRDFLSSAEYPAYLEHSITEACSRAGQGNIVVFVSSTDMERYSSLLDNIQKQLSISIEQADEDIMGGCKALNRDANLFIDNSIASRIDESKESFFQTSCLRIE